MKTWFVTMDDKLTQSWPGAWDFRGVASVMFESIKSSHARTIGCPVQDEDKGRVPFTAENQRFFVDNNNYEGKVCPEGRFLAWTNDGRLSPNQKLAVARYHSNNTTL